MSETKKPAAKKRAQSENENNALPIYQLYALVGETSFNSSDKFSFFLLVFQTEQKRKYMETVL